MPFNPTQRSLNMWIGWRWDNGAIVSVNCVHTDWRFQQILFIMTKRPAAAVPEFSEGNVPKGWIIQGLMAWKSINFYYSHENLHHASIRCTQTTPCINLVQTVARVTVYKSYSLRATNMDDKLSWENLFMLCIHVLCCLFIPATSCYLSVLTPYPA